MSRLGPRNAKFFRAVDSDADGSGAKVGRAYQRCAETGTLNLSNQKLSGILPESVCGFQDSSWAEKWWEQCPVTRLDVSLNTLEALPPSVANLVDCEAFVAYSNELREVPQELFSLPLKQLNLRSNNLMALPSEVGCAASLVELVLSENQLSALPSEIQQLEQLEILDLAKNQLQDLPWTAWKGRKLKRLDVSQNRLTSLPECLHACEQLRELLAAKNQLRTLDFCDHGSLVSLDLSDNKLGSLILGTLPSLDSLNLSNNSLEHLELRMVPQLSVLMAESNKLTIFPEGILKAAGLSTLDLSNNDLTHVPPELGLAQHLTRVALLGNPLRMLRPELLRGGAEALKKFLRTRLEPDLAPASASTASSAFLVELRSAQGTGQLTLAERQLTALPPLPRSLKLLDVSSNHLTSGTLMSSLREVDVLQCLRAKKNRLGGTGGDTQLVPMLVSLQGLQELDLSHNGLSHLGA